MIDWRDSATYMGIIDEGREIEAKRIVLLLGEQLFGPPSETVRASIMAITEDIERLEQLGERLLDVAGWDELLAGPESG